MQAAQDYDVFDAGDVLLQSGVTFPRMQLAYKTYGKLNAARDNVVVYPTSFSAQHYDTQWLVAPDAVLDPDKYFVVIPNLFGNGLSSSPSNAAARFDGNAYPNVTYHDAVAVQRRLLVEHFGIDKVALVYGWSMGGMQAYHWAACFPEMVERIAVVCGSARCSPFNQVFLEGARAALTADPAYQDGRFVTQPTSGFRAMGRVYAGWALSHAFYRDELWREFGMASLEEYLASYWDINFSRRDANDLLAQLWTWQQGDISRCEAYNGDFARAMAAIRARVLLMPSATDCYFQEQDNQAEVTLLTQAASVVCWPIPSSHGHRAGNPFNIEADRAFLIARLKAFLAA